MRQRERKKNIDCTLYAITESSLREEKLLLKVSQAIKGGVTTVQLREKNLSSKDFLNRAIKLREMIPPHITFIIKDRMIYPYLLPEKLWVRAK